MMITDLKPVKKDLLERIEKMLHCYSVDYYEEYPQKYKDEVLNYKLDNGGTLYMIASLRKEIQDVLKD